RRPLGSPCVLRSHPALHSFPTRRSSDLRPRLPPIQFAAAAQCDAEQSARQTRRGIPVIFRRYRWPILFSLLITPLAEFHIEGAGLSFRRGWELHGVHTFVTTPYWSDVIHRIGSSN